MVLVLVLMIASPSAMELQFFKPLACACIRLHRWIAEFILLHLHLFFLSFSCTERFMVWICADSAECRHFLRWSSRRRS